ncbi:unnamed protein product [Sphenostylis stenocarpa]|uniref:Mediator of RNA polymerase II transcription subunit 21 n=1 Tax=Sphenostylis stenocarpa TaxID=92480 RepID=A0AA86W3K0_9FABA|nr:unnamed protein product [Sphenostylis stenocarpa]
MLDMFSYKDTVGQLVRKAFVAELINSTWTYGKGFELSLFVPANLLQNGPGLSHKLETDYLNGPQWCWAGNKARFDGEGYSQHQLHKHSPTFSAESRRLHLCKRIELHQVPNVKFGYPIVEQLEAFDPGEGVENDAAEDVVAVEAERHEVDLWRLKSLTSVSRWHTGVLWSDSVSFGMDIISQLQDQVNLIAHLAFNTIGTLQRDAPPNRLSPNYPEPPAHPTEEGANFSVQPKLMSSTLVKAAKQFDALVVALPISESGEEAQLKRIIELQAENDAIGQELQKQLEAAEKELNQVHELFRQASDNSLNLKKPDDN